MRWEGQCFSVYKLVSITIWKSRRKKYFCSGQASVTMPSACGSCKGATSSCFSFPLPHLWFSGFAQQAATMQGSIHTYTFLCPLFFPSFYCFAIMFRGFSDSACNPGESCEPLTNREETENGSSMGCGPSHKSVLETHTFPTSQYQQGLLQSMFNLLYTPVLP